MARPDRNDDAYDWPADPAQAHGPVVVVALIAVGALVLAVVVVGGYLCAWRATDVRVVEGEPEVKPTVIPIGKATAGVAGKGRTRVYTRQEFRDLVIGKTPDEVVAAVGRPDETTEDGGVTRWTYGGRVRDPGPGEPAATPVVVFREGKVAEVRY